MYYDVPDTSGGSFGPGSNADGIFYDCCKKKVVDAAIAADNDFLCPLVVGNSWGDAANKVAASTISAANDNTAYFEPDQGNTDAITADEGTPNGKVTSDIETDFFLSAQA